MQSGGPVDASYLGGACRGFATSAPDYSVRYTAAGDPLLRFYFLANADGEDSTMIINDPDGEWLCGDDWSASTRNPAVDVSDPETGRYDIWLGSYTEGTTIEGILYVTELESNHP
jgi:hypothetical protein